MPINKKKIDNIFIIFLISHLFIWTLVPSITNQNLPLDTIEALAWGSNLDWGFNKHPPMSAVLVEIFYQIFGANDWAYYLLSQLCVVFSFFIIWKLSKDFFDDNILSLLSVLLLEGIYFFNYTTPEFNVYVTELPFWSLSIFFCWKALRTNFVRHWILFGSFAAFGVLSHYLFFYLLLSLSLLFLNYLIKKETNFKLFISLIPFIIILLPHFLWLVENDFITVTYGLHRTDGAEQVLLDHISHPLIFISKQAGILIPFFLMVSFLVKKFKANFNLKDDKMLFLIVISFLPIALVFLTSLIMGVKIRTMWMTPFYLFFGITAIYILKSQINLDKLKKFNTTFLILFFLSPVTYAFVSISQTDKRTDYPGKEEAQKAENFYSNQTQVMGDLSFVKGNEWDAGNISYHLEVRPKWIYNPGSIFLCNKNLECIKYK